MSGGHNRQISAAHVVDAANSPQRAKNAEPRWGHEVGGPSEGAVDLGAKMKETLDFSRVSFGGVGLGRFELPTS